MKCRQDMMPLCDGHAADVYRGETVLCDFVLRDDTGGVITSVDDVVVLLTDLEGKQGPVLKRLGTGVVLENGVLHFEISSEESALLPKQVGVEVKVVINGVTRIATRHLLRVKDNQVYAIE